MEVRLKRDIRASLLISLLMLLELRAGGGGMSLPTLLLGCMGGWAMCNIPYEGSWWKAAWFIPAGGALAL